MQLLIVKDGKQTGPFSEDQVRSMLAGGLVAETDLCWHEGLAGWLPLSQVVTAATPAGSVPPPLPPPVAPQPQGGAEVWPRNRHPGFWLRVAASLIDSLITGTVGTMLGLGVGIALTSSFSITDIMAPHFYKYVIGVVGGWLYFSLMESSSLQATVGKMACGFVVTDMRGNRISFGRATGRHFGKWISMLTFFIGFLMCAWTKQRQCLHDLMADCLMFKR